MLLSLSSYILWRNIMAKCGLSRYRWAVLTSAVWLLSEIPKSPPKSAEHPKFGTAWEELCRSSFSWKENTGSVSNVWQSHFDGKSTLAYEEGAEIAIQILMSQTQEKQGWSRGVAVTPSQRQSTGLSFFAGGIRAACLLWTCSPKDSTEPDRPA